MLTKKDFYVGQVLYLVPSDRRDREVKTSISSVGRKYVKFGAYMIDLSDEELLNRRFYQLKDYGTRGMFFFSEEDRLDYKELKKLQRNIQNNAQYISDLDTAKKIQALMSKK